MEMTAAYSVFANQGLYFTPRLVERVRDAEGVLLEHNEPEVREATSPTAAYVLLNMLQGVTQRGTAATAAKLGLSLAGKTGTTNDYTDAWFVGSTAKHTIGVWIGHESKKSLGPKATGADVALPIWLRFVRRMKEAELLAEGDTWEIPQGIVFVPVDLSTGYRATPNCNRIVLEAFVNGTQPVDYCGERPHAVSTLPHYLQRAVYTPKRGEPGDRVEVTDAPPQPMPPEKAPATTDEGGPPG
jgi:penicillin-binding protein 1A